MNESHSESPTLSPLVAPALAAYAAELPRGRQRRELSEFAAALARDTSPQLAAEQQSLAAAWLPRLTAASAAGRPLEPLAELFAETRTSVALWKRWLVSAAYPLLIGFIALAVAVTFALTVIPVFEDSYNEFDLDLPYLTRVVISCSKFIRGDRGQIFGALLFVAVPCWLLWWATRAGWIEPLMGRLFGGSASRVADATRLVRLVNEHLGSGNSPAEAVATASKGCRVAALRRASADWAISQGSDSPGQNRSVRSMPATLLFLLENKAVSAVARQEMLKSLSECYAERLERRASYGFGFFTPLTVLIVGVLVLLAVIALFLPMYCGISGLMG